MDQTRCPGCGRESAWDPFAPLCPGCSSPVCLIQPERKRAFRPGATLSLERYAEFLPLDRVDPSLSLAEGGTPLLPLGRLSREMGISVLAKNETVNPTWSFKDRGTAVAVQKAVSLGLKRIGTVSTGNMAASTAAYGARAGLKTIVLVKEDTGPEKLLSTAVHGSVVLRVRGDYGALFRMSYGLGRRFGVYFSNSVDPLRLEGYKLTSFEVFEQLGGRVPEVLVVPVSAGGHFLGLSLGFRELMEQGISTRLPRFVGVQASGCAPLAEAFARGSLEFVRAARTATIAQAISNPDPPGGRIVLEEVRRLGGAILAVTDEEMLDAQRRLAAEEGLFCLPDSAAALAGLSKLREKALVQPGETVVLVLTGTGLKNLHVLESGAPPAVTAGLDDLDDVLASLLERR